MLDQDKSTLRSFDWTLCCRVTWPCQPRFWEVCLVFWPGLQVSGYDSLPLPYTRFSCTARSGCSTFLASLISVWEIINSSNALFSIFQDNLSWKLSRVVQSKHQFPEKLRVGNIQSLDNKTKILPKTFSKKLGWWAVSANQKFRKKRVNDWIVLSCTALENLPNLPPARG